MTFGKNFLGAAAAIGLFAGAVGSANALSITPFNGPTTIKFTGFTTENPDTVGTGPLGGSGGLETTWGAGYVTTIFQTGNPLNTLWQNGKNDETLSFFIYGIADAAIIDNGGGDFDIYNNRVHGRHRLRRQDPHRLLPRLRRAARTRASPPIRWPPMRSAPRRTTAPASRRWTASRTASSR